MAICKIEACRNEDKKFPRPKNTSATTGLIQWTEVFAVHANQNNEIGILHAPIIAIYKLSLGAGVSLPFSLHRRISCGADKCRNIITGSRGDDGHSNLRMGF